MAKAWDHAKIKDDSKHPKAGRAGVIQGVTRNPDGSDKAYEIRLDETQAGERVEVVSAAVEDVDIIGSN